MSYEPGKLKVKNIILTQGKRKYYASAKGLQIILGLIVTPEQLPKILACGANDVLIKRPII